jgi:uncharacterized membrane protein SpoIIM required for sporulation
MDARRHVLLVIGLLLLPLGLASIVALAAASARGMRAAAVMAVETGT